MTTSQSYFFGPRSEIFGWLTLPPGGRRDVAVLLCPPVGHEQVCAYGAFRELAAALGAAGFASLRFDYFGTGNSIGGDEGPHVVQEWIDSIHTAAAELRRVTGCTKLVVLGLRLGATLGVLAATRREDVDGLVLWAPCPDGRSFVRETRVLGLSESDGAPSDDVDAAGFHLSGDTAAALADLSLHEAVPRSVRHALVVGRSGVRVDERTVMEVRELLRSCRASCDEQWLEGYVDFMQAPVYSRLPRRAISTIVEWLKEHYRSATVRDTDCRLALPALRSEHQIAYREQALWFGTEVFGILAEPDRARNTRRAVILLNSGGDHHIGPHRLYVPLARMLAERGVAVLRMDLRGIGESGGARADPVEPYPATALDDIAAGVSMMRERHRDVPLTVAGTCSGGFHAVISGSLPIDAIVAVNPRLDWAVGREWSTDNYDPSATRRLAARLLQPARWVRLVSGRSDIRGNFRDLWRPIARGLRHANGRLTTLGTGRVPRPDIAALLREDREISMLFSDPDLSLDFFREALAGYVAVLEARSNFRLRLATGADHTYVRRDWRAFLFTFLLEELSGDRGAAPWALRPLAAAATPPAFSEAS